MNHAKYPKSFLESADPHSFLELLTELYPNTTYYNRARLSGESQEAYTLRMEADKESCFALMASNTLIAANGARAMQIAKIVRTGLHLATTMAKKSGTRSGRRETFLGWLEFIGFNYTTDPSERTRLVKFYLDTLPLLEGITQKKLSDEAIINLHKDQGDFAAKHVQRIANELVDALNRLNMLDVGSAQRILDELEDENPNASELEREIGEKMRVATSGSAPQTLSETSVTFAAPQEPVITPPAAYTRDISNTRVKITIEAERTLLPLIRQKLGDLGIDIDSLRIIE